MYNNSRSVVKEQFLLYTKDVYFTFNDCVYLQNDGVAMGSQLGPVLTDIIMVELETKVAPTISCIVNWKCFVDDTVPNRKTNKVEYVLEKLNSLHKNIQFMYEPEQEKKL